MARKKNQPQQDDHKSPINIALAWKMVAQMPEGQVVLQDLISKFGFTRTSMYAPGQFNANDLIFREGQRSVLLHVGRMIDADPAQLENANKEAGEMT